MKTICPYFNQGLFVGADSDGRSEISMCCWQKKIKVDTVSYDDPYLLAIRDRALVEFPTECSPYCDIPGHVANEKERSMIEWRSTISGDIVSKHITVLHLEQSLTCNLTCISCSSRYSSAWNNDYHLFDPSAKKITLNKFPEEKWKNLDLSHLKRLHFTGGEPLLNRDNKKILRHLKEIGVLHDVFISYNTNGTIIPDDETLDLWRQARFVRLFFSLDGIGSVFEYTRFPAKWDQVQRNIDHFRSLSDICILIEVNAIVGIHNVFSLREFFDWWEKNCADGSQGDPSAVFVRRIEPSSYGGRVLDLKHLSTDQAAQAIIELRSMIRYPGVIDLVQYIENNRVPDTAWLEYFIKLDQLRGTDWKKSLATQLVEIN